MDLLAARSLGDFEVLIKAAGSAVHPARLSHDDLKKAGLGRCTDRKIVLRRTKLFPKPPKAAGEAGAAVVSKIDSAVVTKLEKEFSSHGSTIDEIRKQLAASKGRIASVEKAYRIAPPAEPVKKTKAPKKASGAKVAAKAKPVAVLDGTVLKIAADDAVMTALAPFLRSAVTVKVEVSEKTKVSGFGSLEGAVAVLSTIASEAPEMLGSTALQRAKVQQWCGWGTSAAVLGANKDFAIQESLASLNAHLAKTTLITGRSVTIADLVCWAAVKPMLMVLTHMVREKVPHVCRWFNYVQHKQGLESSPLVFNLNAMNWRKTEH